MPRCVAFLRAVNVGGRTVKMDALRAQFEGLGLANVQTFIASGNVLFDTRSRNAATLERKIEAQLMTAFGFEIHTFIRTASELAAIAQHHSFDAGSVAKAKTHVVGFLASALSAQESRVIEQMTSEFDSFHAHEREIYWLSRQRQSESKFSNATFEKTLKLRSTFRGIDTVRKLLEKISSSR
jgi:uncharacterized protein (DUF1697 family)